MALLFCWLVAWMMAYRYAILDDSLIHLRYADFLRRVHFITFDGVHRTFGTSSLLFVGLLALLRGFTASPLMPRAVSSVCHLVLFGGFAGLYLRSAEAGSRRVRMLALVALFLLVPLSALRWLDDGMETSLVMCLVCITAWWVHRLSVWDEVSGAAWGGSLVLGFALVLLRNELAIVDGLGVLVLLLAAAGRVEAGWGGRLVRAIPGRCGLLLGGMLTEMLIRLEMGTFLPDTALAKSHGMTMFGPTIGASEQVMAGSLLFGLGAMAAWGVSAVMVLRQRQARTLATLAANALFPVVLLASAARGQEIQGVRYFIWTFFFPIVWNLLELRHVDGTVPADEVEAGASLWSPRRDVLVLGGMLGVMLLAMPADTRLMRRILAQRGETTRMFLGMDLASAMRGETGVAYDVGYIAYFSGDPVCDLNGLVNGAGPAAMTVRQRAERCAAERPGFAYLNKSQDRPLADYLDLKDWVVCGRYDLPNVRTTDRHWLLVRPEIAGRVCAANRFVAAASPFR